MKLPLAFAILVLLATPRSPAQITLEFPGSPRAIADNTLTGIAETHWLGGLELENLRVREIEVVLQVAGGWNGDLYAQLSHNGVSSVLLNRVGVSSTDPFGYSDAGFSVTFADAAPRGDIHWYRNVLAVEGLDLRAGPLTGTWAPDGRPFGLALDPASQYRAATLNVFADMPVTGNWTLFLADLSAGGQAQWLGWGLRIDYIPEPRQCALASALGLLGAALRHRQIRKRSVIPPDRSRIP
jgi:hypothetical protein